MRAYPYRRTRPIPLTVGRRVKFTEERTFYTVRGVSEHFVVLTKPQPFVKSDPKSYLYTIIEWSKGWRGPTSHIGNGYSGLHTERGVAELLHELEQGLLPIGERTHFDPKAGRSRSYVPTCELSHRRSIYLDFDWYEDENGKRQRRQWRITDDGVRIY